MLLMATTEGKPKNEANLESKEIYKVHQKNTHYLETGMLASAYLLFAEKIVLYLAILQQSNRQKPSTLARPVLLMYLVFGGGFGGACNPFYVVFFKSSFISTNVQRLVKSERKVWLDFTSASFYYPLKYKCDF